MSEYDRRRYDSERGIMSNDCEIIREQLGLYQTAINRIDDYLEYAYLSSTGQQIRDKILNIITTEITEKIYRKKPTNEQLDRFVEKVRKA